PHLSLGSRTREVDRAERSTVQSAAASRTRSGRAAGWHPLMPRYALDVWLDGTHVGLLREARTRKLELRYTTDTLGRWNFGDPVLSVALPLTPELRHPPGKVGAFLEGLLPEGQARSTLEDRYGVLRGDTLGLLRAIGRECAGAVVFQPHGDAPAPRRHPEPSPI